MGEQYRIGIDVGGTNTDAVMLNSSDAVIAKKKSPTTPEVGVGVENALIHLLTASKVDPSQVRFAMLSTTACTNAITTRRGLVPIGLIRLGAPATTALPLLATWPEDLRSLVLSVGHVLGGGHEFTGEEIAPLDEPGIQSAARAMKGVVRAVAISGVFSPVNSSHEERAREIVAEVLGAHIPVTLSSEIGSLGLLEREGAAALNASLFEVAQDAIQGFQDALIRVGFRGGTYFGQNDGTLMSLKEALRFPVLSIASGPANSIRGAAFLSGVRDGLVVDIGGTTSDFGILWRGFPRESTAPASIGGVRTNFRMPDILSIGLGGGSLVKSIEERIVIGPETVGYKLREEALVFGGTKLTCTDLAVAADRADIGDRSLVKALPPTLVSTGIQVIAGMIEDAVDRIKISANEVPIIVVGGGSVLAPDTIQGTSAVLRPDNFDVANAVGVAIAQISSSYDQVVSLAGTTREAALNAAKHKAIEEVLKIGADPSTVELLEVEEIPLAYLGDSAIRIRIKAAGLLQA